MFLISHKACLWAISCEHILTWQQHSFLPHHSVKALRKRFDKIIGVCLSGCSVDFLCGNSFRIICPICNIISYGAWKQHWLLQKKGEREKPIFNLNTNDLLYLCAVCCTAQHNNVKKNHFIDLADCSNLTPEPIGVQISDVMTIDGNEA